MPTPPRRSAGTARLRVLKTKWFSKAAKKQGVTDAELCEAAKELEKGQGDDLGGGVWKKRLLENRSRGLVLVQGAHCWLFTVLYAKADLANISDKDLRLLQKAAGEVAGYSADEVAKLVKDKTWIEVTGGD